jgi:hypothetical protein
MDAWRIWQQIFMDGWKFWQWDRLFISKFLSSNVLSWWKTEEEYSNFLLPFIFLLSSLLARKRGQDSDKESLFSLKI